MRTPIPRGLKSDADRREFWSTSKKPAAERARAPGRAAAAEGVLRDLRDVVGVAPDRADLAGSHVGVLSRVPPSSVFREHEETAGFDQGKICTLNGGYLSFAKTKAERVALGDPRPSLEERYGTDKAYVDAVKVAAARAVAERFLLRADGHYLVAEAAASDVLAGRP
jgi:hypothetical protein